MTNDISIEITAKELTQLIKRAVKPGFKEFADCIIYHYTQQTSFDQEAAILAKAAMGITPQPKYPIGSTLRVGRYGVSMYDANINAMKGEGLIDDEEAIFATLESYTPYSHEPYVVKYTEISNDGTRKEKTVPCTESYIRGIVEEQFPGD